MSLYEMDFLSKMVVLLKEAFRFKKYKAMHPALAVFTGIFMLPLVLASAALVVALASLSFMFAVLSAPVKYLHDILHGEGQTVKHATQTVLYLISWPVIFFLYVLMSFLLILILPTYAALAILTYAWSLGGFKFHIFMNKVEDISIEVKGRYTLVLPLVFICVGALVAVLLPMIDGIDLYLELFANYMERMFVPLYVPIYVKYIGIHGVFAFVYSLIAFAPRPKAAAKKAEAIEE